MSGFQRAATLMTFTCVGAIADGVFMNVARAQASAGDEVWGVTQMSGEDEPVSVAVAGEVECLAGGAFSEGDQIEVGTGGKAVVLSGGTAVARAMEDGVAGRRARLFVYQTK